MPAPHLVLDPVSSFLSRRSPHRLVVGQVRNLSGSATRELVPSYCSSLWALPGLERRPRLADIFIAREVVRVGPASATTHAISHVPLQARGGREIVAKLPGKNRQTRNAGLLFEAYSKSLPVMPAKTHASRALHLRGNFLHLTATFLIGWVLKREGIAGGRGLRWNPVPFLDKPLAECLLIHPQ